MTIQSLSWALEQPIPGAAKLVLLAMANHASHTSGCVLFDTVTISREASVPERSLWRYIGALERNGYLHKHTYKRRGEELRDYRLCLSHVAQEWQWAPQDDVDAPEGVEPSGGAAAPSEAPDGLGAAAEPAERPGALTPIFEGSKEDEAWSRHFRERRRLRPFVRTIIVNGKECRGYWMPSLRPLEEPVL